VPSCAHRRPANRRPAEVTRFHNLVTLRPRRNAASTRARAPQIARRTQPLVDALVGLRGAHSRSSSARAGIRLEGMRPPVGSRPHFRGGGAPSRRTGSFSGGTSCEVSPLAEHLHDQGAHHGQSLTRSAQAWTARSPARNRRASARTGSLARLAPVRTIRSRIEPSSAASSSSSRACRVPAERAGEVELDVEDLVVVEGLAASWAVGCANGLGDDENGRRRPRPRGRLVLPRRGRGPR
jgi:hypothetical protein